jgi:hypothetical protein
MHTGMRACTTMVWHTQMPVLPACLAACLRIPRGRGHTCGSRPCVHCLCGRLVIVIVLPAFASLCCHGLPSLQLLTQPRRHSLLRGLQVQVHSGACRHLAPLAC